MALPTTPKQCDIKIRSLKKQVTAMEQRKRNLLRLQRKRLQRKRLSRK